MSDNHDKNIEGSDSVSKTAIYFGQWNTTFPELVMHTISKELRFSVVVIVKHKNKKNITQEIRHIPKKRSVSNTLLAI